MAPKKGSSKRARSLNLEENAPLPENSHGLAFKNDEAQSCFNQYFSNKKLIGNGLVHWAYFETHWKKISDLFEFQGWKAMLATEYPVYPDIARILLAHTSISGQNVVNTWYMQDFRITPSMFNIAFGLRDDNSLVLSPHFSKTIFGELDKSVVWRVLTDVSNRFIARKVTFPKIKDFHPLARMVHRIIIKTIDIKVNRGYSSEISIWLTFHVVAKKPVNLGHYFLRQFHDTLNNANMSFKNPGWFLRVLETQGLSFANAYENTSVGAKVDKSLVLRMFTCVEGTWMYRPRAPRVEGEGSSGVHDEDEDDEDGGNEEEPSFNMDEFKAYIDQSQSAILNSVTSQFDQLNQRVNVQEMGLQAVASRVEHQNFAQRRLYENLERVMDFQRQCFPDIPSPSLHEYPQPRHGFSPYPQQWLQPDTFFGQFTPSMPFTSMAQGFTDPAMGASSMPPPGPSTQYGFHFDPTFPSTSGDQDPPL